MAVLSVHYNSTALTRVISGIWERVCKCVCKWKLYLNGNYLEKKGTGSGGDGGQTNTETEQELEINLAGVRTHSPGYKRADDYNKNGKVFQPVPPLPSSHLHLSLSNPSSLHPNQSLPPPSLMHSFMCSPISPPSLLPSLPHPDVSWPFCRPSTFLGVM